MHALTLLLPGLLLVHNPVDFSVVGARSEYVNLLNCIVTDYVEILEDHNNLRLVNKTGYMDEKIGSIGLQFESYDHYTMSTARTLMIGLIESFLDALNQSCRLSRYLYKAPFTPDDIEIRVNFIDTCKYPYPAFDEIKYMSFSEGVISYSVGSTTCLGELVHLRDESYDFARQNAANPAQFVPPRCRPVVTR
jgi:hypothetical protein